MNSNKEEWCLFKGNDKEWEELIKEYPESTYLDKKEWSLHLEEFGWNKIRLTKSNKKTGQSILQGFIKFLPFSNCIVWIPGGILGPYENLINFPDNLKKIFKLSFCLIRIRSHQVYDPNKEIELLKNRFRRPLISLSTTFKVILNLEDSIDNIRKRFSRSWKRSLKRSYENKIKIINIKNAKIISDIYKDMKSNKKLSKNNIYTEEFCSSILKAFGEKLIVIGAEEKNTKSVIAIRGIIISNNKSYDIFAASNNLGRNLLASHILLYTLIKESINRGCKEYDLSNIDPINSMGVYNFKKGTGGEIIQTLGEFEWTNSIFLKIFILFYTLFKKLKSIK